MPSLEVFMVGSLDAAALVGIFFLLADQICVESAPLACARFCLSGTFLPPTHSSARNSSISQ
jgi:hypothetical protein